MLYKYTHMPPKITYTREKIIELTFDLLRKEGVNSLSARNISKKLGMSTMIIYSNFHNMEELVEESFRKAWALLSDYQRKEYSVYKIFNLGLGYINFAIKEKILFKWMFQEENVTKEFWRDLFDTTYKEILPELEKNIGKTSTEDFLREIYENLWIYAHGLAMLLNTGAIELKSPDLVEKKLMDMFKSLIAKF